MVNNTTVLYKVSDIQSIFKCGKNRAYGIMNSKNFPSFRVNGTLYVEKSKLESWISRMPHKTLFTD
ncbi:MAG: hypothetical protein PUB43_03950 [Oscillospiraceae bacterium]|nr:hypothetical protein [Oscillospiraceae bacterium]